MVYSSELSTVEFAPFYKPYIDKSGELELIESLKLSSQKAIDFFKTVPAEKHEFSYASNKWTIKEILLHLIDAERIFAYRALRFARNDKTPVLGFEENDYVPESYANTRSLEDLLEEYKKQRESTLALLSSFSDEVLKRVGVANGSEISVRAIGFIIVGHETHHLGIIKERYL